MQLEMMKACMSGGHREITFVDSSFGKFDCKEWQRKRTIADILYMICVGK